MARPLLIVDQEMTQEYKTSNLEATSYSGASANDGVNLSGVTLVPPGCKIIRIDAVLPWDNGEDIVSQEFELITQRVKAAILLPILFLIGGPGNVINMAVFARQGLRDRINVCLFSLSLADLLYLLHCMCLNGEEIHRQFTEPNQGPGPMFTWYSNHNLSGFFGFCWVSFIISAIIASERCFCVVSPLRSQTVLTTRTMTIVIVVVFVVVTGGYFIIASKYRVLCGYEVTTGVVLKIHDGGEFYHANKTFVDFIDSIIYGLLIPILVMVVVAATTATTTFKLRQAAAWRSESSSATLALSSRQVALTKMLIGNSVLFLCCVVPICMFKISLMFDPEMNVGRKRQNLFLSMYWVWEMISYVNSCFNIVIYYAMGSRYRQTLWELCCCRNGTTIEKREGQSMTSSRSVLSTSLSSVRAEKPISSD